MALLSRNEMFDLGLNLLNLGLFLLNPQNVSSFMFRYIRGAFNKFQDFFVQAFKIIVDS